MNWFTVKHSIFKDATDKLHWYLFIRAIFYQGYLFQHHQGSPFSRTPGQFPKVSALSIRLFCCSSSIRESTLPPYLHLILHKYYHTYYHLIRHKLVSIHDEVELLPNQQFLVRLNKLKTLKTKQLGKSRDLLTGQASGKVTTVQTPGMQPPPLNTPIVGEEG